MLSLLITQLCLGFTAFLTRVAWGQDAVQPELPMVISTVAHVAVGALLLATTVILAIQVWRHVPVALEERVPQAQQEPRQPRDNCQRRLQRLSSALTFTHCLDVVNWSVVSWGSSWSRKSPLSLMPVRSRPRFRRTRHFRPESGSSLREPHGAEWRFVRRASGRVVRTAGPEWQRQDHAVSHSLDADDSDRRPRHRHGLRCGP